MFWTLLHTDFRLKQVYLCSNICVHSSNSFGRNVGQHNKSSTPREIVALSINMFARSFTRIVKNKTAIRKMGGHHAPAAPQGGLEGAVRKVLPHDYQVNFTNTLKGILLGKLWKLLYSIVCDCPTKWCEFHD